MNRVGTKTEDLTDYIKECWLLTPCDIRHIRAPSERCEIADNRTGQNGLKTPLIPHCQGKMTR